MSDLTETSESEILASCLAGKPEAFAELYSRYSRPLYAYIMRLLAPNFQETGDIFQQTWLKVIQNMQKYTNNKSGNLFGWICTIAYNLVMDYYRQFSRRPTLPLDEKIEQMSDGRTTQDIAEQAERAEAVEKAILTLTEKEQQVIRWRQDGKLFRELAEQEGESLNTVIGRLQTAIHKLKLLLTDFF